MPDRNRHVKITERVSTRLKLKQLRLLVAISKHSSILHAAEEICISQPAATKLLKDLETDFNVQLFHRTNRGVIPTEYGEALVRHGKLILAQISHAAQELDDLNEGLGGRVVVGTLLAASARLLPKVISVLHEQRPNVSIVVRDGTNDFLMPLLHSGELDMVVGRLAEYRYREELVQEILYREEVVVACREGHPLSGRQRVTFEELAKSDWILPPTQTTLRRQIDKEFFDRGLPSPSNPVECVSYLTNRALLLETNLIGVFPLDVVQKDISTGGLAAIGCQLNITKSPVGVSFRNEDALSPAATAFLAQLRTISANLATNST
ncbi:MAG: LysR family transcriptional regulator [Cohaesibacteraceae bacterium]|nr:LysR family transcriptional regulator [Cohaesibacteraceae bacterium]